MDLQPIYAEEKQRVFISLQEQVEYNEVNTKYPKGNNQPALPDINNVKAPVLHQINTDSMRDSCDKVIQMMQRDFITKIPKNYSRKQLEQKSSQIKLETGKML